MSPLREPNKRGRMLKFKLRSLSSRLRLGIGAIVFAFIFAGAVSIIIIVGAARDVSKVLDESGPTIMAIADMESSVLRQQSYCTLYSSNPSEDLKNSLLSERTGYNSSRTDLARYWKGEAGAEDRLKSDYQKYIDVQNKLISTAGTAYGMTDVDTTYALSGAAAADIEPLVRDLSSAESELLKTIEEDVSAPARLALITARQSASLAAWHSVGLFGVFSVLATILGFFMAYWVTRSVTGSMNGLVDAMDKVASGDTSARLEKAGISEFEPIESSFNDMAERLDEAEAGLKRSYASQRKILDEIPVGFLTIDRAFRVEPEYSSATERILGRGNIAGGDFTRLLYPEAGAKEADELARYLKQLFENRTADIDFLADMNPVSDLVLKTEGKDAAGKETETEKNISIRFDRIYEGETVSDLLATIEDRTDVKKAEKTLAEEQRARKRDSDSIQAILSIGPGPLKDFFLETRDMISKIRGSLGKLGDREAVNFCFRCLHSIKGAAGSFGIEAIATVAHEAESIFADLRDTGSQPTPQDLVKINVLLGNMSTELDSFEALVMRLKETLSRLETVDSAGGSRDEVADLVQSLSVMTAQLQKTLGKSIKFETDVKVKSLPHMRELRQIMIHLIRNSADHGIEDEFERLFQGKDKTGTISLRIRRNEGPKGAYVIEVEDDGQGINFERVAEKAWDKGLLAKDAPLPSHTRLISYLFMPGFSTKEKVDEISGRGVGLDLVADTVKTLGGSIAVASERGRGSRFTISIPPDGAKA